MKEATTLSFRTLAMKINQTRLRGWLERGRRGLFLEMMAALSVPICFWGLIGNATVFWLLCRKVKKTTFKVYFLNMIVADFIVAAYFLIVFSIFLASFYVNYHFLRAMENMYSLASNASFFLLTAICLERYFMVSFPLYYQQHRPKVPTKNVCGMIWFCSFLMAMILYVFCYQELLSIGTTRTSLCDGALIFDSVVHIMVLFPIISFSALSLFIRRVKQRTESRLDITLMVMVILSFLCIFSFQILDFLSWWVDILRESTIFQLSLLFECIKTCISPLVYFFVGNRQKQKGAESMYKLLERALSEKESTDRPSAS